MVPVISRWMHSDLCIVVVLVVCVRCEFSVRVCVGGLGCWVVACVHELILLLYPGERCKTKKVPSAKNISSVEYMFDSFLNLSSNDGMDNRQWQASCEQMHLGLQLHLVDYLALLSQGLFYTVCSTWQWPAPQLDQCHLLLQIV